MAIPCLEDSNTIHHAQDAGTGSLVSDVIRDPSAQNLLSESASGLLASYTPSIVSTLPATPDDGQISYYDTADGSGTVWVLRYNSGSASPYKWEFVGGGVIFDLQTDGMTRPNGGYAVGSGGTACQVTTPSDLEGDYMIHHGGRVNATDATAWQTVKIGAAAATDTNAIVTGPNPFVSLSSHPVIATALPASSLLTLLYKNDGTGSAAFNHRWIEVRPMRVKAI